MPSTFLSNMPFDRASLVDCHGMELSMKNVHPSAIRKMLCMCVIHIAIFLYNFLSLFYWQPRINIQSYRYFYRTIGTNRFYYQCCVCAFSLLATKQTRKDAEYYLRWFFTLTHTSQIVFGPSHFVRRNLLLWKKKALYSYHMLGALYQPQFMRRQKAINQISHKICRDFWHRTQCTKKNQSSSGSSYANLKNAAINLCRNFQVIKWKQRTILW